MKNNKRYILYGIMDRTYNTPTNDPLAYFSTVRLLTNYIKKSKLACPAIYGSKYKKKSLLYGYIDSIYEEEPDLLVLPINPKI